MRTPLVIAMWKQLADAYGYPKRKLGYKQLGELATGGWAAVGKPQFGTFKYVHTNPDFSTSGLSAVAASYYAAVGKKEGLTEADVDPRAPAGPARSSARSSTTATRRCSSPTRCAGAASATRPRRRWRRRR